MKVVHITSVHPRFDSRIFQKECVTLTRLGVDTYQIVADGLGSTEVEGVKIIDVGDRVRAHASTEVNGRLKRMLATRKALRAAIRLKADAYHFHDPELIFVGLLLRLRGKPVIYDVHEDTRLQVLVNPSVHPRLRKLVSFCFGVLEDLAARVFNGIIAATPEIAERFPPKKTAIVQNFPILANPGLPASFEEYRERPFNAVYAGVISKERGVYPMVEAFTRLKSQEARLHMAGKFSPLRLENEVCKMPGWQSVDFVGWLDKSGIEHALSTARLGIVVLEPVRNYLNSYPVKLFEYMAAGLPVIASDFPLWRKIVEDADCGRVVDPLDSDALADAIDELLARPDTAYYLGQNGRRAIETTYNWNIEQAKLTQLYDRILGSQISKRSGMESRKQEEIDFHGQRERDHQTLSKEEFEKKYPNKKFYAITKQGECDLDKWLRQHCGPGTTALDYCCGLGQISIKMARHGAKVFGIDISSDEIETAKKNANLNGVADRTTFQVMDAEKLTFDDKTFDVIVCAGVLHHLDLNNAYPELSRVLKPNGRVFCMEALGYNPLIQLYRKMTPKLRTAWEAEHILTLREVQKGRQYFGGVSIRYYYLFSILAIPFRRASFFKGLLSILGAIDAIVLRIPLVQRMAWQMFFEFSKPKGSGR